MLRTHCTHEVVDAQQRAQPVQALVRDQRVLRIGERPRVGLEKPVLSGLNGHTSVRPRVSRLTRTPLAQGLRRSERGPA